MGTCPCLSKFPLVSMLLNAKAHFYSQKRPSLIQWFLNSQPLVDSIQLLAHAHAHAHTLAVDQSKTRAYAFNKHAFACQKHFESAWIKFAYVGLRHRAAQNRLSALNK
eukprot:scaffold145989_cov33-Tisochrysis_lutea.AAC.1